MTEQSDKRVDFKLLLLAFPVLLETSETLERQFAKVTEDYPQFEPVREEIQNAHNHLLRAFECLQLALIDLE